MDSSYHHLQSYKIRDETNICVRHNKKNTELQPFISNIKLYLSTDLSFLLYLIYIY
jgi:hypothetical protein